MEQKDAPKKKKIKKNEEVQVVEDRFSNLPEPVLHHILCFLNTKHVVQTSVLSKKWRSVWTFVPFLNFNCEIFHSIKTIRADGKKRRNKGEWFKHFVDQVVSKAPALLESNSIQFSNLRCLKLKTWLTRDCVNAVTYLLEISPSIESLFLEIKNIYKTPPMYPFWDEVKLDSAADVEPYWEAGVPLPCMLFHLKFVEIQGVHGRLNELLFLEILLKNAMVLEKMILHAAGKQSPQTKRRLIKFNEQLLNFPRASSSIAISLL